MAGRCDHQPVGADLRCHSPHARSTNITCFSLGLSDEIGLRGKTDILRTVAYAMQTRLSDKSRSNFIDGETLESLIEDYLHDELHFDQARAAARALVEQLRQRNFIICYLGADSYAFVHRTFLEYFCAADIVHQFNVAKTLDEQGLIALFDRHCRDDNWREVLRLICGQIDEQFVGRIIEHLATRTDSEKWDGETPLPELPLAIYCLSEHRNSAKLEMAGRTLFEHVLVFFGKDGRLDAYPTQEELIEAALQLRDQWPGVAGIENEIVSHHERIEDESNAAIRWPIFVAAVGCERNLILQMAKHSCWTFRSGAYRALGNKWPDDSTRRLLEERAVQDDFHSSRGSAIHALAESWPDETTRRLLEERALHDEEFEPRLAALRALAGQWPDESTRMLLEEQAVKHVNSIDRWAAIQTISENWPDETTRKLLAERALQDDEEFPRSATLQSLAEKWPDETTLELLESQVSSFKEKWIRSEIGKSIEALREKLSGGQPRSGSTT